MSKKLLYAASALIGIAASVQTAEAQHLENAVKLTNGPARYDNPQWSPDGKKIAYTRFGYDGLYVADAATRHSEQICDMNGVGYMYHWDKAGSRILVRDTRYIGAKRVHAAWCVNVSDHSVDRLTSDAEQMQPAAWKYSNDGNANIAVDGKLEAARLKVAPDSRTIPAPTDQISFITDCESLYAVDASGDKKLIYTGAAFGPKLSPDKKHVVFATMNDEIKVMNIDGTAQRTITKGFSPEWLGNDRLIFHRTTDDGHTYLTGRLHAVSLDNDTTTDISTSATGIEMNPSVSPDGTKVAFVRFDDGQIYVADIKR